MKARMFQKQIVSSMCSGLLSAIWTQDTKVILTQQLIWNFHFFNLPRDFIIHNNCHLSKCQKTKMSSLPWKSKMSKLFPNMLKTKSHDFGSVAVEMADKKIHHTQRSKTWVGSDLWPWPYNSQGRSSITGWSITAVSSLRRPPWYTSLQGADVFKLKILFQKNLMVSDYLWRTIFEGHVASQPSPLCQTWHGWSEQMYFSLRFQSMSFMWPELLRYFPPYLRKNAWVEIKLLLR